MAYARFGWQGSDVYVYLCTSGYLECCGCLLGDKWNYYSTQEMLDHLEQHKVAGHTVPDTLFEDLKADQEENDKWIANYDPVEEQRKRDEANQRIEDIWNIAKDELGYEHPGPEKFDWKEHDRVWKEATKIYEARSP